MHSIKRGALSVKITAPGGGKSSPKLIKQDGIPRASMHQLGEMLLSGTGLGISPGTHKVNKLSSSIDYGKQWLYGCDQFSQKFTFQCLDFWDYLCADWQSEKEKQHCLMGNLLWSVHLTAGWYNDADFLCLFFSRMCCLNGSKSKEDVLHCPVYVQGTIWTQWGVQR